VKCLWAAACGKTPCSSMGGNTWWCTRPVRGSRRGKRARSSAETWWSSAPSTGSATSSSGSVVTWTGAWSVGVGGRQRGQRAVLGTGSPGETSGTTASCGQRVWRTRGRPRRAGLGVVVGALPSAARTRSGGSDATEATITIRRRSWHVWLGRGQGREVAPSRRYPVVTIAHPDHNAVVNGRGAESVSERAFRTRVVPGAPSSARPSRRDSNGSCPEITRSRFPRFSGCGNRAGRGRDDQGPLPFTQTHARLMLDPARVRA
jgi:hypothetical protein